jgi:hypothetical protein
MSRLDRSGLQRRTFEPRCPDQRPSDRPDRKKAAVFAAKDEPVLSFTRQWLSIGIETGPFISMQKGPSFWLIRA